MKLCWDNINKSIYTKNNTFIINGNTYRIKKCNHCGESYLGIFRQRFCSNKCSGSATLTSWKGGIKSKDPKAYNKRWKKENRDKCNSSLRQWKKDNNDKWNNWVARRRALKRKQFPKDADREIIQWYYTMAKQMSERIGILKFYHVDHIIPIIKGGLHHENNLQIITANQNLIKGDKI